MTNVGRLGALLFVIIFPLVSVLIVGNAFVIVLAVFLAILYLILSIKVIFQYDRGVLFFLGKYKGIIGPGIFLIFPFVEVVEIVTLRVQVADVPPQETISKDNIPLDVNAVAYYRVDKPDFAVLEVEDYRLATSQIAQTTIRSIVGQHELDEILIHRDEINTKIREIIDDVTDKWGIEVILVELKDVELPENLKRAMAKQAEAERERRARVILAKGELQASETLADAGDKISKTQGGMQLRFLQTMTEIAAERNSAILFPFPVDIMEILRKMQE